MQRRKFLGVFGGAAVAWPHAKQAQEGPGMKKAFAAFVAVATIAGSLAATPASAQRGVAPASRSGPLFGPPLTEQVAGHTTILAVANG